MFSQVKLDRALASKAEGESSTVISTSGAYTGKFTQVYNSDSPKADSKASFMHFAFTADNGQTANIRLNVQKADGTDSFGMGIFHAVMTVLRMRELHGVRGYVTDRFGATFEAVTFKELCNKPIGVLLQREEYNYRNRDGEDKIGWNMTLQMPFDANTRQSAKEILENAPARRLDERIPYVKDKLAPPTKSDYESTYRRDSDDSYADKNSGLDSDDEDMPF